MSIRAHRVIKTLRAPYESFNLWHDEAFREFLERECDFMHFLNEDCCGTSDVPVTVLEKAILQAKKLSLDESTIKALQNDINWAKRRGDEYISYDCF